MNEDRDLKVVPLWPRWTRDVATMLRMNVRVRTRCATCGSQMRVDLGDIARLRGSAHSLVDQLGRCPMVGCNGTTFYLAARTYGQEWWRLLRDEELIAAFEDIAPARVVGE